MSPRRMDISSLLRDPSPPHDDTSQSLPPSLLTILNAPHVRHGRHHPDHGPFLGLDALVHVASEERRRISLQGDHDRHPDARPNKRARDTCPPSPSRSPSPPPISSSPSTRHQLSASPTIAYPTLRQQPILHIDPPRSAPCPVPHTPSFSFQHTSPFSHPLPLLPSPHRRSPQLLRSHHHSSPSLPTEPDAMSPRYSYGPRMAGGIDVLSSDPSPVRDTPRPEFPFYQSPKRELSPERLPFESHSEQARHEPKLSPLSVRPFSLNDDRHQAKSPAQERGLTREWARPRHFPLDDATTETPETPAMERDERHPIRVWEEQSTREAPRRVSPTHISSMSSLAEARTWPAACESRHDERPDAAIVSRQGIVEIAACKKPPSPRHTASLAFGSRTPVEGTRLDSQLALPVPMQSESQAHLSLASLLNSSPLTSTPSILDIHLNNCGAQPKLQPELAEVQPDPSTHVLPSPSDPIGTESVPVKGVLMHVGEDSNASLEANLLPGQPPPKVQPSTLGTSTHSVHAHALQSTSRSPSQQSFPLSLPDKDGDNPPPMDTLIPSSSRPEIAPGQSLEPETIEREPSVPEQAVVGVEEELLGLIEDRPVLDPSAMSKAQHDPRSPINVSQASTGGTEQSSQVFDGPPVPSSQLARNDPQITDEGKDRVSMPPPAPRNRKAEKDKTAATGAVTGGKKKKDGTSKATAKPKQLPKPRAKPAQKLKAKSGAVDPSLKTVIAKGVVNINANARSRSTSIIPGAMDDVVQEPEADESDKEDDKLYCVCKTRYNEDRMMIACDRCDEWYHTLCVNISDLDIDLVDQFICPPCVQRHPHLRTTWKRRCLLGLQHPEPSSSEACHKPSRGAFSKYCSDDCGIKFMQGRIAQWDGVGGARDLLWEGVKNATKREGVVVCAVTNRIVDSNNLEPTCLGSAAKRRAEREVTRLNIRLEEVVKERELMKRELDMVVWRDKVVELASERAGRVDECGWDQRLCFGEEEWANFGQEVLESYEEERVKMESEDDAMPLDVASATHGEWWCTGKKKCERHAGWQKLRTAEVSFDKETKEGILLKLTTREREIRKWIEDILYPPPSGTLQNPLPPDRLVKPRSTGHVSERGKKKSS